MDNFYKPFGPIILEEQLPIEKINWLNNLIEQAPEEVKSKSIDEGGLDMQKYLSGNITGDQIAIPKYILFDPINGIMPDILNGCEKYNNYVSHFSNNVLVQSTEIPNNGHHGPNPREEWFQYHQLFWMSYQNPLLLQARVSGLTSVFQE